MVVFLFGFFIFNFFFRVIIVCLGILFLDFLIGKMRFSVFLERVVLLVFGFI